MRRKNKLSTNFGNIDTLSDSPSPLPLARSSDIFTMTTLYNDDDIFGELLQPEVNTRYTKRNARRWSEVKGIERLKFSRGTWLVSVCYNEKIAQNVA